MTNLEAEHRKKLRCSGAIRALTVLRIRIGRLDISERDANIVRQVIDETIESVKFLEGTGRV